MNDLMAKIEAEILDTEGAMTYARDAGEWRRFSTLEGHKAGLLWVKNRIEEAKSKPAPQMVDGMPRRIRLDLATPAEKAIRHAVYEVERAGASVALTDAVVLLGQALERVADHVERL